MKQNNKRERIRKMNIEAFTAQRKISERKEEPRQAGIEAYLKRIGFKQFQQFNGSTDGGKNAQERNRVQFKETDDEEQNAPQKD